LGLERESYTGCRESLFHRSKGILDLIHSDVNGSMSVAEDEEKKALKGEQSSETSSSGSQPSGGEEELSPSSFVRRPSWYELTLRDAQEQVEAPRSTFRERRPPKKFPNFVALMSSIIDSESSSVQEATRPTGLEGCHGAG
jgi:hypothetical protein